MASVLDISILNSISVIFLFILIWVIVFGLLELVKIFGPDRKNLHAIIAFCIALLSVVSPGVVSFFSFFTPWFFVWVLFIFFVLFAARMFGGAQNEISNLIKDSTVHIILIIVSVIIAFFALGHTMGQTLLEEQPGYGSPELGHGETSLNSSSTNYISPTEPVLPDTPADSNDYKTNFILTIFHPKVLGMVFLLMVAAFTIMLIARRP